MRPYFRLVRDGWGSVVALGLRVSRLGIMIKMSPSLWYDKADNVRGYHLVRVGIDHEKKSFILIKIIILFFVFVLVTSLGGRSGTGT